MPMLVAKVFLVDTDSADEAYELTKPASNKVETYSVGRVSPYDPATATANMQATNKSSVTGNQPGTTAMHGVVLPVDKVTKDVPV